MTDLTSASFLSFVEANRYAVVHFRAEWNGYDAKMKNLLESRVPGDISKKIAFGSFDTGPAEHWAICREHRVLGVPFLAFYRDGKLVKTLSGLREEDVLIGQFRDLLS
jgi:Thioredoxin